MTTKHELKYRLKVGDTVVIRANGRDREATVAKVGRVYYTLSNGYSVPIRPNKAHDNGSRYLGYYEVWLSAQAMADNDEAARIRQRVRSFFDGYRHPSLPLDVLRAIEALLPDAAKEKP